MVKRLAEGLDHQEGLLIRISFNMASRPGAFPGFKVAVSETTSSGETESHSGELRIVGIGESERPGIEKILEKWETQVDEEIKGGTGLVEGQFEEDTRAQKAL